MGADAGAAELQVDRAAIGLAGGSDSGGVKEGPDCPTRCRAVAVASKHNAPIQECGNSSTACSRRTQPVFLECDLIEFEPGGESTPQRTSGSSFIAENAGPSSEAR